MDDEPLHFGSGRVGWGDLEHASQHQLRKGLTAKPPPTRDVLDDDLPTPPLRGERRAWGAHPDRGLCEHGRSDGEEGQKERRWREVTTHCVILHDVSWAAKMEHLH